MIKGKVFLIIILVIGVYLYSAPQEEKNRAARGIVAQSVAKLNINRKRALVIGIDSYPNMPLEAAVADAKAVSKRLKELGFGVTTLLNGEATLKTMRHHLGT